MFVVAVVANSPVGSVRIWRSVCWFEETGDKRHHHVAVLWAEPAEKDVNDCVHGNYLPVNQRTLLLDRNRPMIAYRISTTIKAFELNERPVIYVAAYTSTSDAHFARKASREAHACQPPHGFSLIPYPHGIISLPSRVVCMRRIRVLSHVSFCVRGTSKRSLLLEKPFITLKETRISLLLRRILNKKIIYYLLEEENKYLYSQLQMVKTKIYCCCRRRKKYYNFRYQKIQRKAQIDS